MSVADEAVGLIKGLVEVVKSQQSVQQNALQKTDQLQTLSNNIASLTQNLSSSSAGSPSPGLRLSHLVLPIYTGREHLDRFLSKLESIWKASGVPPKYWLTYFQTTVTSHSTYYTMCQQRQE